MATQEEVLIIVTRGPRQPWVWQPVGPLLLGWGREPQWGTPVAHLPHSWWVQKGTKRGDMVDDVDMFYATQTRRKERRAVTIEPGGPDAKTLEDQRDTPTEISQFPQYCYCFNRKCAIKNFDLPSLSRFCLSASQHSHTHTNKPQVFFNSTSNNPWPFLVRKAKHLISRQSLCNQCHCDTVKHEDKYRPIYPSVSLIV